MKGHKTRGPKRSSCDTHFFSAEDTIHLRHGRNPITRFKHAGNKPQSQALGQEPQGHHQYLINWLKLMMHHISTRYIKKSEQTGQFRVSPWQTARVCSSTHWLWRAKLRGYMCSDRAKHHHRLIVFLQTCDFMGVVFPSYGSLSPSCYLSHFFSLLATRRV